jgi:hypothetical protein
VAIVSDDLDQLSSNDLGVLARDAMSVLALRGDQETFAELLSISTHAGQCLGGPPPGLRRVLDAGR